MTNKHSYGKVGVQKKHGRSARASAEVPEAERCPGGMVVQKRDGDDDAHQQPFQIRVSYGPSLINLNLPSTSTFRDVKRHLAQEVGLDPCDQRLFYRGIEKDDNVLLCDVSVKNLSKLLLREVEASKEKKLAEIKKKEEIAQ